MKTHRYLLGRIVVLVTALAGFSTSTCRADFVYAATEFSLEWLTDASRAIVVGQVIECDVDGRFQLRIDHLLKRRGVDVVVGQTVVGESLGRSSFGEREALIAREIGWPSLLDPATYPSQGEIFDRRWSPPFRREETWTTGDRCMIFFGYDLDSPLQIINLDRPAHIEVDFLAIDREGQPVSEVSDLFARIRDRVRKSLDSTGRPRVCSAGSVTWPKSSAIDGSDYYYILVPPDVQSEGLGGWLRFQDDRGAALEAEPADAPGSKRERQSSALLTSLTWYPSGKQTGVKNMIAPARDYWWNSGRSPEQFAADAQFERNAAIGSMVNSYPHQDWLEKKKNVLAGPGDVDRTDRNQLFRCHRTNYRSYPLGWRCVMSYDAKYFAFVEGFTLQLWEADPEMAEARRLIATRRDVHRARTYVEFSWDSRYMAYSTADDSVCLIDARTGRVLWQARGDIERASKWPEVRATVRMQFSEDHRYLVQQSERRSPKVGEVPDERMAHAGQAIHVWDVATGESVLAPWSTWQWQLKFVAFHPENSNIIRLRKPIERRSRDQYHDVWEIDTRRLLTTVPDEAIWDEALRPQR